ncbi:hypothetical protein [Azospirillum argentinense]
MAGKGFSVFARVFSTPMAMQHSNAAMQHNFAYFVSSKWIGF